MMIIKICPSGNLILGALSPLESITTKTLTIQIHLLELQMSEVFGLPIGLMTGQAGLFPVSMQAMRVPSRYLIHLTYPAS
ncbi:hypothetical protein PSYRMG_17390 [Pseudomonas syringae UMAF0158]|nr:hypothetical protein PSYRMG_17390 [Pseudomonas syringae UMAF0158]